MSFTSDELIEQLLESYKTLANRVDKGAGVTLSSKSNVPTPLDFRTPMRYALFLQNDQLDTSCRTGSRVVI